MSDLSVFRTPMAFLRFNRFYRFRSVHSLTNLLIKVVSSNERSKKKKTVEKHDWIEDEEEKKIEFLQRWINAPFTYLCVIYSKTQAACFEVFHNWSHSRDIFHFA